MQGAEVGPAKPYIPPYLKAQTSKFATERDQAMAAPSPYRSQLERVLPFLLGALVGFAVSELRARR
jgi:hypothetical protein